MAEIVFRRGVMRLSSAYRWVRSPGTQGDLYQTSFEISQISQSMGNDLEVKN